MSNGQCLLPVDHLEPHSQCADDGPTGNATTLCHSAGDSGISKAAPVVFKPTVDAVGGLPRQPDPPKEELCKLDRTYPPSQYTRHGVLHEGFGDADIPLQDLNCSCSSSMQPNCGSTRSVGSMPGTTYYGGAGPAGHRGLVHIEDRLRALDFPHHPNGSGNTNCTTYPASVSISNDSQAESSRERHTDEERPLPPGYNGLAQTRSNLEEFSSSNNTYLANQSVCERKTSGSAWCDELRTRWTGLGVCERVVFIMASLVVLASFVTLLALLGTIAKGKKNVGRRIFLGCMLLSMVASGVAMAAVRRNLGEVLFAMIMIVVIGMFLNSYLDLLI
jgi:hypothetical protein